ncbi:response regulator [Stieleria magnilauensis]
MGLKTAIQIMLGSRYAMWVGWGPEFTFFYNDAYSEMTLGPKHPWALGRPASEVWSEIWDDIGPLAESVLQTGQATWDESMLLFLERKGFPEETYHTFSYSPLPFDGGGERTGGMLCVVTEDTKRTIGERRLATLRELAARTMDEARSIDEACRTAAEILAGNPQDLPFALIYLFDQKTCRARLAGRCGLTTEHPACPAVIDVSKDDSLWPLREVIDHERAVELSDLSTRIGHLDVGIWPEPPQNAMVVPLAKPGQDLLAGFLIAGASPRLELDDSYRGFFDLLAGQLAAAVANAEAYEAERRRAEALAELDRSKTVFFSNVSHEFRTPLTLMLGPVEDLLSRRGLDRSPADTEQLEVIHRNGLRLLRLVNSLLDFSRIEAGRVQAQFQATDLAAFTRELASVFRSAIERAGLRLQVEVDELSNPVHVDRDMWEKIVLNLLSNAFKFTFDGEIVVTQREVDDQVRLTVRDTGTGVPQDQIPRLFERFHRIENARGRTHEGSGIGLALVQELVKLHQGTITAESALGQGTSFTVCIPIRREAASGEQAVDGNDAVSTGTGSTPYVEEALRWLADDLVGEEDFPDPPRIQPHPTSVAGPIAGEIAETHDHPRSRILVADDNADMRQYIKRLLSDDYSVTVVADGQAAWERAQAEHFDLILTDVMMPRLDGYGLLARLRENPRTRDIPIIMLSARAGEESRVDGMEAGADDYLVKPFSARELVARVRSHVRITRLRRETAEALHESESRLRLALTAARMVAWQWDPHADVVHFSENVVDIFGLQPDAIPKDSESAFKLVHPDDLDRVDSIVQSAIATGGEFQLQFRAIRADNRRVIWIEERGHAVVDASGKTLRLVGVVVDITDRKRAEVAMRERADQFRAMADNAPTMLWITERDGSCTFLSRGWYEFTGQSEQQGLGFGWIDAVHPEDRERITRIFKQANQRQEAFSFDYRLRRADGKYRWAIDAARPRFNEEAEFEGYVGAVIDVHERKQAEEFRAGQAGILEMIANEQPVEEILTELVKSVESQIPGSFGSVLLLDEDGQRLCHGAAPHLPDDYNAAVDGIEIGPNAGSCGTAAYQQQRNIVSDINHDPRWAQYKGLAQQYGLKSCWSEPIFAANRSLLGTFAIYFRESREPTQHEQELLEANARFAGIAIDRPRAQAELRESEESLRDALNAAGMGRWRADLSSGKHTRDANLNQILGFEPVETVGPIEDRFTLVHRNDREVVEQAWKQTIESEGIYEAEFRVVRRDQTVRWLRERGRFKRRENEASGFVTGLTQDITEQREFERSLKKARQLAQAASTSKSEFIANMSHEIRTPMTAILGYAELLEEHVNDDLAHQHLRTIRRNGDFLLDIINDILDLSKIEAGKLEVLREYFSPHKLIQDVRSIMEIRARENQLTFTVDYRGDIPSQIESDPKRLKQILINLLGNAVKFTKQGSVSLVVELLDGGQPMLQFQVIDTGIGISAEQQRQLFQPFFQGNARVSREFGGTGLGLVISQRLANMLGGGISVQSELGQGSTVTLQIAAGDLAGVPMGTVAHDAAETDPAEQHNEQRNEQPIPLNCHVLLVDDRRDIRLLSKHILQKSGARITEANDGLKALEAVAATESNGEAFDIVLLDMQMPNLDGYETAGRLRARGFTNPIIALTADAMQGDMKRCVDSGCDDYLSKPIDADQLIRKIRQFLS